MNLIRTSFFSSISTAIKILSALIVAKLVAFYVGPDGLGKMGQFISLMSIMSILAGGGISNGIIKYVAEYRNDMIQLKKYLSCGLTFTFSASLFMAMVGLIFSHKLSIWLLGSDKYVSLILVLVIAQCVIAGNNFLVAIINGLKEVRILTINNVCGTLVGLLIMLVLIAKYNLYGALLALILMQAVPIIITLLFLCKSSEFKFTYVRFEFSKLPLKQLGKYSLMAIISAICVPLSQIIIRNHLASSFSWTEVGYWQAITRISDVYLLFFTTVLTVYCLPKLAETSEPFELKKEILVIYKILLPLVIIIASGIFVFKMSVIKVLFTPDFIPMANLFAFQMLGDVLKIGAWILAFVMLAKAMTKTFIITEVLFSVTFVLLSYWFTAHYGLVGVTYAFALNYLIYWITMGLVFANILKTKLSSSRLLIKQYE